MAIGFQGEPVAPGRRSGRPTTMNSKRPSCSQASGDRCGTPGRRPRRAGRPRPPRSPRAPRGSRPRRAQASRPAMAGRVQQDAATDDAYGAGLGRRHATAAQMCGEISATLSADGCRRCNPPSPPSAPHSPVRLVQNPRIRHGRAVRVNRGVAALRAHIVDVKARCCHVLDETRGLAGPDAGCPVQCRS